VKIWLFRALAVVASLLVSLIVAEGVSRFMEFTPPHQTRTRYLGIANAARSVRIPNFPTHPDDMARFEAFYALRYIPGSAFATEFPDNPRGYFDRQNRIIYRINADGYRGRSLQPKNGRFRIVLIGDSFTMGIGVWPAHTYARRLEDRLGLSGYEVYNLGVHGYGLHDHLALLDEHLARYEPDAVVLGYFLDDICRPLWRSFSGTAVAHETKYRLETPSQAINYLSHQFGRYRIEKKYVAFVRWAYSDPAIWKDFERMVAEWVSRCARGQDPADRPAVPGYGGGETAAVCLWGHPRPNQSAV
jgi:hypothetical protein